MQNAECRIKILKITKKVVDKKRAYLNIERVKSDSMGMLEVWCLHRRRNHIGRVFL